MNYEKMRQELKAFYFKGTGERGEEFRQRVYAKLDSMYREDMSSYEMKVMQYNTIVDMFDPVLFYTSPYYYETGTMWAHCDGGRDFRGFRHAGGWTYDKNHHYYVDRDPKLFDLMLTHMGNDFYTIGAPGGAFNDTMQHFNFNARPIFEMGLKGIYEKARAGLEDAEGEEILFLNSVCDAMLALKKMSEKYAAKAKEMMDTAPDEEGRKNMQLIYETAMRTPWEKPQSLYEALNVLAFMRKAMGALEGVGPNTFGRVDMDLYPFYEEDIKSGRLTKEGAYDLICKFLLTWDLHFDHDFKMVGYSDHELENTYVLGGCDLNGNPLYNDLTQMFLRATREEDIIFPKITCRYSKNSPKEYLDEANVAVINGTSTLLYQNDDVTIPAVLKAGKTLEEARDYLITGCWAIMGNGIEKIDDGCYVNVLKVFEYTIHQLTEKMKEVEMTFAPIDDAKSFEELYKIYCDNVLVLFKERARVVRKGGSNIWNKIDPLPIFSSTLKNCIENKKDYTNCGAKYNDSRFEIVGFPNVVDSLLAIKHLCFDTKKYTLAQMLDAVRRNWEGCEDMRREAIRCHGWGDGSQEASEFAARFNNDLYKMAQTQTGTYGGKIVIGHFTYTEIRFYGERTLATPDGRYAGDYISQGLTPSRLKIIPSVTDVVSSFAQIDSSIIGGNSVVNFIIPCNSLDVCEAFLRSATASAIQSLQLNCTTREQLLDAQKHPENYPNLIVRVCGFSAKFTSLSPEWQQEVLSRNFYK
ncbi:MAG: hypothetical protein IKV53_03920 [Clostridia bacterium]|nr:hypothetical protein [Clostridia bacterium]